MTNFLRFPPDVRNLQHFKLFGELLGIFLLEYQRNSIIT